MAGRIYLEERLALVVAVALHAGLLAVLVLRPAGNPLPPPPRMEVSLADAVGPQESAPAAKEPAAADIAPKLGTALPPPAPQPLLPKPAPQPQPKLLPKPVALLKPLPIPAPKPQPAPPSKPKPAPPMPTPVPPKPVTRPSPPARLRPEPSATPTAATKAKAKAKVAPDKAEAGPQEGARKPAKAAGGSRIGADFLTGATSANSTGKGKTAPSQIAGPAVIAALSGVISRQLKPHWTAPQGADADRLVTILTFDLNRDGTLDGPPRVVRQEGVTDSNRPQAARHAEQAIRAVELAEPFQLPPEYYDTWKHITTRLDRKLSQ